VTRTLGRNKGSVDADRSFRRLLVVPAHGVSRNLAGVSVAHARADGVTVLPSAEGRSLRSDPRWTRDGARRADRLLQRLVRRRRARAR
jgi:hypothetical protein